MSIFELQHVCSASVRSSRSRPLPALGFTAPSSKSDCLRRSRSSCPSRRSSWLSMSSSSSSASTMSETLSVERFVEAALDGLSRPDAAASELSSCLFCSRRAKILRALIYTYDWDYYEYCAIKTRSVNFSSQQLNGM